MPQVTIITPGLITTVQDLGRRGHGAAGVAISGAVDPLSLRIGNWLLGNPPGAAGLEMTLHGPKLQFDAPARCVLAGSEAEALLVSRDKSRPVSMWRAIDITAGDILRVGRITGGARTYLCICGGIHTPLVMGSRSTHLSSGIGGLQGWSCLRPGDVLLVHSGGGGETQSLSTEARQWINDRLSRRTLRITASSQTESFAPDALRRFVGGSFQITESSSRVGIRLLGPRIEPAHGGRMITEPMPVGGIQITEDGQPIVLLNDGPTTGGYPLIAAVSAVDLPVCGQLRPRDHVRFELVARDASLRLFAEAEEQFQRRFPSPGGTP